MMAALTFCTIISPSFIKNHLFKQQVAAFYIIHPNAQMFRLTPSNHFFEIVAIVCVSVFSTLSHPSVFKKAVPC